MTTASVLGTVTSALSPSVLHGVVAAVLLLALVREGRRRLPRPPVIEAGVAVLVVGTAWLFWLDRSGDEAGPVVTALVQSAWVFVVAAYPDWRRLSRRWRGAGHEAPARPRPRPSRQPPRAAGGSRRA